MSFPVYPEYKDSGVPWLGEVPEHWELSRVGSRFSERREKVSDTEYPPLSVTKNGIVPQLDTAAKTDDNDNRKCVLAGDFVINSRSDRKGSSGLSTLDGSVSLINTVISPDDTMNGAFVHHLFRSVAFQEEYYRYGKGIVADLWSTNYGEMKAITIAVPPMPEQTAIAAFLDRETAKIDALVAEQERLIALLKEKRQAVISYAVTKGLNPDAPMKDSGIEWLGEIPAHWEIAPLKRIAVVLAGYAFSAADFSADSENWRLLRGINLSASGIRWNDDTVYWSREPDDCLENWELRAGDIVLGMDRPWIGDGLRVAEVTEDDLPCLLLQRVAAIRSYNGGANRFILQCLRHEAFFHHCAPEMTGVSVPHISGGQIETFQIPIPPHDEMLAIAEYVETNGVAFERLVDEARSAVALLQERRAALISAAVTGKIDVRSAASSSNVVPIKSASPAAVVLALRAVVGAYAIRELGPMGRMAVMKGGFLAEAHAGFSDLNGRYERFAAGPYDRTLLEAMEQGALELCGIVTHEPRSAGEAVTYEVPSTAIAAPGEALRALVGEDAAARFREMLSLLKGIGRQGVEAVATIYAVWNDLLADGQAADNEKICRGVLTDWHDEKAKKFNRAALEHWLAWMRRHGFEPDGTAPRTDIQGKLF